MKKFRFSLDTVLSYKQQIQDSLQSEHAESLARVRRQEKLMDELLAKYRAYCTEYRERCETGLPITDVLVYQSGLRAMEREIEKASALDELLAKYRAYCTEYRERCETGLPITDVLVYQSGLRAMEREIEKASAHLEELRRQEEKKRMEFIEAKRETASIEKLREKKLQDYQKALDKSNELFIEEFVSTGRVRNAAN